ncbi:hypothetical protein Cgig2_013324 [Carnegiea gigantea]|uniref:Uncharacterized protein n=1 Tax=Carnegiea gigantea TaxID=171969 RepID=A0A9Q1GQN1_9CARY|nr:hypothetical protein Cgig2_013324 [Carnegiea gigantea]
MDEYEEIVYRRQAKKWANSLIVTPNSHPNSSLNKSRRPGSRGVDEGEADDSFDANFDAETMHEASEEKQCNQSLVDSDECGSNDGSDTDELLNANLEDEIPRYIDANAEDDDRNPSEKYVEQNVSKWKYIEQLMIDFKANPTMQAINMQKLTMERDEVIIPTHTYDRVKKLLKS